MPHVWGKSRCSGPETRNITPRLLTISKVLPLRNKDCTVTPNKAGAGANASGCDSTMAGIRSSPVTRRIIYASLGGLAALLVLFSSSHMAADPVVENGKARVWGRVTGGGSAVGNATVALVRAADVGKSTSIQPVEDLAAVTPYKVKTNADGAYTVEVPSGRYFVYVIPDPIDTKHLPGGEASNRSVDLSAGGTALANTELSERPSPSATWVGTSKCLSCHVGRRGILETRHFNGLRIPGFPSKLLDFSHMKSVPAEPQFTGVGPQDTDGNGVNDFEQGMAVTIKKGKATVDIKLGYVDNDKSGTLTNGDYLTATFGGKTYHIWYIDGAAGEGYENGKQRITTKLDAQGDPIPLSDMKTPGSLYVLPFQLKEYRGADGKIHYKWDADVLDNWLDKAGSLRPRPNPTYTYDNKCIGCHAPVAALQGDRNSGFRAVLAPNPAGQADYKGDGSPYNANVTCERCHGPGSDHVAVGKGNIVNPGKLAPAARSMVCGQCHQRGDKLGEGRGTVDAVWTMYPSKGKDGDIRFPKTGISFYLPAEFYGQPNGDGILPDFGTKDKTGDAFLNPMNFNTDDTHSWMDKQFGAKLNHSTWMHHDYADHTRNRMYKNEVRLVGCADCHDAHKKENPRQLRQRVDNNALCLNCHNGDNIKLGEFLTVTQDMVDALERRQATGAMLDTIAGDVMKHIRNFTFKATGLAMDLPVSVYNPESPTMPVGSCISCHMPKVIGKNMYHYDAEGFLIEGDTRSHTFDIVLPRVSRNMAAAGVPPVPNSCVSCHRGTDKVRFPDFRFKKGEAPGDKEFIPATGWINKVK